MLIAFTGLNGVGQTFLDWSFNFVVGRNKIWHYQKGWLPISSNPVGDKNSHIHKRNHPGMDDLDIFFKKAKEIMMPVSFYPFMDTPGDGALPKSRELMARLIKEKVKIILVESTKPYPYFGERTGQTEEEVLSVMGKWLGKENMDKKTIREEFSFNLPGKKGWSEKAKEFYEEMSSKVLVRITQDELLNETEKHLIDIIEKVDGQRVREKRLEEWRPVQKQWHESLTKFNNWYEQELPKIVEAIIENKKMILEQNELYLIRQAVVMNHLMKDHGRRLLLPTDDFPLDTQILHGFLK